MVEFGIKLKSLRDSVNMTAEKLAELSGVSLRTIRGWETGEVARPQPDRYDLVADVLATASGKPRKEIDHFLLPGLPFTVELLNRVTEIESRPPRAPWVTVIDTENTIARRIPLGDDIAAGDPIEGQPVDQEIVRNSVAGDVWPWDDRAFGIRVRGHSMFPDFRDGDIVIGSPGLYDQIRDGDDVCVLFTLESKYRGGRTLKRVEQIRGNRIRLHPINPEHETIEVGREEIADMGPVAAHVRYPVKQNKRWDLRRIGLATRHPKGNVQREQEHPDYEGPDANSTHPGE
jgi:SOS-response transcriptional repressor LexA